MKRVLMAIVPALFISQGAFAGAAQAVLDCTSASGKTKITASFPGDMMGAGVIMTIENRSLALMDKDLQEEIEMNAKYNSDYGSEYKYAKLADIQVDDRVLATKNTKSAFQLEAVSKEADASLVMKLIAGSSKVKRTMNGSAGSFSASVTGTDPRSGKVISGIVVKCQYHYEI